MELECKLCSKKFSNRQGLGGHMKSHFALLPLPPKTPQPSSPPSTNCSSSSASASVAVDRESPESESKSTRRKRDEVGPGDLWVGGDDDVAWCLVMLSRDVYGISDQAGGYGCDRCERVFMSSQRLWTHMRTHLIKKPIVHECPFCDKIFGSGQALGGHKRSHFRASRAD